jgi:hypothetical protein
MMKFNDYVELSNLFEKIDLKGDQLVFDYNADVEKSGEASTKLGKGKEFNPFQKKISSTGKIIYSVYNVKESTPVLKAIKSFDSQNATNIKDYQSFLKRTAIFISSRIFKEVKPDVVITPKSSSNILNDIIKELQNISPHIIFLQEKFKKIVDPEQIKIDYDNPSITPKIIDRLENILRKAKRDGYFQLKAALPQNRKFLQNYFELIDDYKYEKIEGKNIILLDDVVSSGSTFDEMMRILEQYAPNEISGVTIFKTN